MMIKMINGASLKVQIFLYYASMAEKSTNKFPYFEQDMTEFNKMGMKKLRKNFVKTHRKNFHRKKNFVKVS